MLDGPGGCWFPVLVLAEGGRDSSTRYYTCDFHTGATSITATCWNLTSLRTHGISIHSGLANALPPTVGERHLSLLLQGLISS